MPTVCVGVAPSRRRLIDSGSSGLGIAASAILAGAGGFLVSNKSSLCIPCEEFKHSKSFAARARLLQIQIGADCLCRSRALATKAHRFRLVRLRMWSEITSPICTGGFGRTASLQDACLASCTARLAPSRASQLLGAKRGVIPDHILSRTSRNQKGNINPRSCARFSDVQPIYVLANVLGLTKRKFVTHWV